MTSVTVRGDQMADELGGICVRHRFLSQRAVATSGGVIWIVEADLERLQSLEPLAPQILDVVNPAYPPDRERFAPQYLAFRNMILTTESSRNYLGPEPEGGRRSWVIPHHHCNADGWVLPEARLARPRVVGYLGQPEHLHDADEIRSFVERLGYEFRMIGTRGLAGYREIDVGIAWTRREEQRDLTRSNIKLSNFAAHGVPSVVCDYESYRAVNDHIGPVGLIRATLPDFLEALAWVLQDESLRRDLSGKAILAQLAYSRSAIGDRYRTMLRDLLV